MWTIWTSLSAVRERPLNLITHSLPNHQIPVKLFSVPCLKFQYFFLAFPPNHQIWVKQFVNTLWNDQERLGFILTEVKPSRYNWVLCKQLAGNLVNVPMPIVGSECSGSCLIDYLKKKIIINGFKIYHFDEKKSLKSIPSLLLSDNMSHFITLRLLKFSVWNRIWTHFLYEKESRLCLCIEKESIVVLGQNSVYENKAIDKLSICNEILRYICINRIKNNLCYTNLQIKCWLKLDFQKVV